ncbi:hydroxymethylglutaryl-CoA lyase [Pullulanibacillus camelliae]|uniref:Hydroxymethylglutaryl-CoA lyase n=1 Tax=Pullulanibacillus camelliae TaxID=1707096 RepID=A0A8J2VUE9_9BACL|nr:hydroxymethylglutaryl-CoA lyase [Pullulanibacillus camelliae]GGE37961.1 hydroxymethylglutaryl-CoA lyase [Pullulanibacillus camelliae]
MVYPKQATLIEVSACDGLQNEMEIIPTEIKIQFIQALKAAHIEEMELVSFISSKKIPQLGEADTILQTFSDAYRNIVLAENGKGIARFLDSQAEHIALSIGVSSTFNQKCFLQTTEERIKALTPLISLLKEKNKAVRLNISTAFYCPYEGKIHPTEALELCEYFAKLGVNELSLSDTIGLANPKDVKHLVTQLKNNLPPSLLLTGHFHNTRGAALANIYACLEIGMNRFDTSAGGLGTCPFSAGASGNIATEDVAFMLNEMDIDTGIDIDRVIAAVDIVSPYLSRPLDSKIYALRGA